MSSASSKRVALFALGLSGLLLLVRAAADPRVAPAPPAADGPVSTASTGARCIGPGFDDTAAFQAALDTGRTVYAPALGGHCHITRPLTMRTPGQILHGDGRARTRLVVAPGFSGAGVFVAATGGAGPVWRDLAVQFVQPDVADRAKLTRYPPAFLARATPRFEIEHVGCYAATTCIDMTGNSGGATVSDFQMSAFETGIDIDGSLDTVRIIDPHWWPFALTPQQQKIFLSQGPDRAVALRVGRMDDLVVRGGLFLGGLGLYAHVGKTGPMFGTITGTDFDTTSGIVMEAGMLQISGVNFTLGQRDAQAIHQSGGELTVSSAMVFIGGQLQGPAVDIVGGHLTLSSSQFLTNMFDLTSVAQAGAQSVLVLTGNVFSRNPALAYSAPTIDLRAGRTIAIGNYATDKGGKAGIFARVLNDNEFNRFIGNASPGWTNYFPSQRAGAYSFD